jgi:mannosyltransferase
MLRLSRIQSHLWLILSLLITLLGTYWRLMHLGTDGLWLDETITVIHVRRGFIAALEEPNHPPLLQLISTIAIRLFGESEFAVRIPAAFLGILGIPLVAVLGKVMGYPRAGLWAALLLALSPFHLRYSQDARNYGLLVTVSTLTYVTLYLAVKRPRFYWWMAYGVATAMNFYSHYGSFVVLVIQLIWLAGWGIQRILQRDFRSLLGPILSGVIASILYSVWLPRFLKSITVNSGATATGAAGGRSPWQTWIRESLWSFSNGDQAFLVSFVILLCLGLLFCLWYRNFGNFSLLILGVAMPILLIFTFDIARYALPKFVIYILPIYLLTVALGLDGILSLLNRPILSKFNAYPIAATALTTILFIGTFPLLQQEHDFVQEDWKGVAQTLVNESEAGDIFIAPNFDAANGFSISGYAMPYYLNRYFAEYRFSASNRLKLQAVDTLKHNSTNAWFIMQSQSFPIVVAPEVADVRTFQGSLYLGKMVTERNILNESIALYEQMVPMAAEPSPRCLVEHDLATLYAVAENYVSAQSLANDARAKCTDALLSLPTVYALQNRINRGMVDFYTAQGDTQRAEEARIHAKNYALQGLRSGVEEEETLAILLVKSLMEQFDAGMVQIEQGPSTERVEKRPFEMPVPQGGTIDGIATPLGATVIFEIEIPDETVFLDFRYSLDPTTWEQGGDGSTFVIKIRAEDGTFTEIFRQHLSNTEAEHYWHGNQIALNDFQGQNIRLIFMTEPGPNGDSTSDLGGWTGIRILRH